MRQEYLHVKSNLFFIDDKYFAGLKGDALATVIVQGRSESTDKGP